MRFRQEGRVDCQLVTEGNLLQLQQLGAVAELGSQRANTFYRDIVVIQPEWGTKRRNCNKYVVAGREVATIVELTHIKWVSCARWGKPPLARVSKPWSPIALLLRLRQEELYVEREEVSKQLVAPNVYHGCRSPQACQLGTVLKSLVADIFDPSLIDSYSTQSM